MKNREIKDSPNLIPIYIQKIQITEKKWITFNNYNYLYMIHVDKFDKLLPGFTGTLHSVTVSSAVEL